MATIPSENLEKTLKQIHPKLTLHIETAAQIEENLKSLCKRILNEALRLHKQQGDDNAPVAKELSTKAVRQAVDNVVGGQLCKHAVSEGK